VGLGKIIAARFQNDGKDFYAFYFESEGRGRYYDENTDGMEKAFLKAPLKYTRITSLPSESRLHPILNVRRVHPGTDYAAPRGTPIHTVGDGFVQNAGYQRGYGKYVVIKHNDVYTTEYLHMSKIEKGIKPGVRVNRGDVIGYVGSTGCATGPHLDFRFWKNGKIFNHLQERLPVGKPLKKQYIEKYKVQMKALKHRLDNMPLDRTVDIARKEFKLWAFTENR
jgi:murein DD-endopeptidase MepM/ murein hydrolase activator NlpD